MKRTLATVVVALLAGGVSVADLENPVVGAGGVQTAAGDVFVAGQAAIGVALGSDDLGIGAVECWFDASGAGCAEDINGDGVVNLSDLSVVLTEFGQSGAGLAGDLNGDGSVNLTDLSMLLGVFGVSC